MADDERRDATEPSETDDDTTQQDQTKDLPDGARKALEAARRDARAAERKRKELENQLREISDRDKSEAQRTTERAETAERRAAEAERRLLKLEVAARKGLPAGLATRLTGDSEEDLESDADALMELVGKNGGEQKSSPRADPDQGKGNGQVASEDSDMNAWMRRAAGVHAS